jgi:hypothetical protein
MRGLRADGYCRHPLPADVDEAEPLSLPTAAIRRLPMSIATPCRQWWPPPAGLSFAAKPVGAYSWCSKSGVVGLLARSPPNHPRSHPACPQSAGCATLRSRRRYSCSGSTPSPATPASRTHNAVDVLNPPHRDDRELHRYISISATSTELSRRR